MCGHQHWTQHYVSNIGCRKETTSSSPKNFWASILLRFTEVKVQSLALRTHVETITSSDLKILF